MKGNIIKKISITRIIRTMLVLSILTSTNSFYSFSQIPLIGKGINLDFGITQVNKVGYDPGFYEVFKHAGFTSVRFFVKLGQDPVYYKEAIDDALNLGLTVVISGWAGEVSGKKALVDFWREYAWYYRMYPEELVFELLNEPQLVGHKRGEEARVMSWLGACIVAIRETNPSRLILVGGPSFNQVEFLTGYVTPEYLDYRLPDGTGFLEDQYLAGKFHTYDPMQWTHIRDDGTSLNEISPDWKKLITNTLDEAQQWSKKYNKPVILTEWGTRLTNRLEDIEEYVRFIVDECAKRNIEWMYYCGVFSNAWAFALYNSEWGWKDTESIVRILTEVKPTLIVPTNQIVNPDFTLDVADWMSTESVVLGLADHEGVNGSRAIRCHVRYPRPVASLYQQLDDEWRFPNRGYLIQLREGNTYTISFYAKIDFNTTTLRVQLGHAPENDPVVWTSEPVQISENLKKYELTYVHNSQSIKNVRFSILFDDFDYQVILDRIKMRSRRD